MQIRISILDGVRIFCFNRTDTPEEVADVGLFFYEGHCMLFIICNSMNVFESIQIELSILTVSLGSGGILNHNNRFCWPVLTWYLAVIRIRVTHCWLELTCLLPVASIRVAGGLSGPYCSIFAMFLLLADCEAAIPSQLSIFQGFSGE
jgi:hypothetical protein